VAVKEVALPAGAELHLTLTSEIVLAGGVVGDTVIAKLSSNIKLGKDVLAPKGAIARGRIVKLERQAEVFVLSLHFTDLEWPGGHAFLNMQFETLDRFLPASPVSQMAFYHGSGADEIVIPRSGPSRLKDLPMRWRVAP
jgi:hypothetical protein